MCAGFRVAESGNVLLSQPGNRNSRAVRSFAIPAFMVCCSFHSTRVCKLCLFQFAQFIVPYRLHLAESPAGRARFRLQVQCRTLVGIIWKTKLSDYMKRKDPPSRAGLSFHGIRQRPTLPDRLQPSTIGAERLNFCVRYGNRWIPFAIVTGKL